MEIQKGTMYFFTGLAGAGKTTLGRLFYQHLRETKPNVVFLDGDLTRASYWQDVDYSTEARRESSFRGFHINKVLVDQGIDVVACAIAMYDDVRAWARENIENYVEIYVRVEMETLYKRDQKGLYQPDVKQVVGKDLPWDEPKTPDLIVQNDAGYAPEDLVAQIEQALRDHSPAGTVLGADDADCPLGGDCRHYGDRIDISSDFVHSFWEDRAAQIHTKGFSTVGLKDQRPGANDLYFQYARDSIVPELHLDAHSRVLDLGCGMGRWAKIMEGSYGTYCGVDFSGKLLEGAREICADIPAEFHFREQSIVDAVEAGPDGLGGAFDAVIINGVTLYINDDILDRVFCGLPGFCKANCSIYIGEPLAYQERLTLDNFASSDLNARYSAIYRTPSELEKLLEPMKQAGFKIEKQGFLPRELGGGKKETNSYLFILRRRCLSN